MERGMIDNIWHAKRPSAVLVLANGQAIYGHGCGAIGSTVGEVCFNTAMSGYQEIITDPSYNGQIVTFTFPHIGNVGTNDDDIEAIRDTDAAGEAIGARGILIHAPISIASNYRSRTSLNDWLCARGIIGMAGIDCRAITRYIRMHGMFDAALAHAPDGEFDIDALAAHAQKFGGLEGTDRATRVSINTPLTWQGGMWCWDGGFRDSAKGAHHIVALDFGIKRNILRCLTQAGCHVTLVPALTSSTDILALKPDGIFLSNGPGDPSASAQHANGQISGTIKALIAARLPIFGICLGHQLLAHALGLTTTKMAQGHHGANHPVQDIASGKVEITSMNHGFTVARDMLPDAIEETHISLFDGSNCGIRLRNAPVFSVQYHPEASPGPQDSYYLFERFVAAIEAHHA